MTCLQLRALVTTAALLAAPTALGQELVEKVAVRNRLHTLNGRSELGLDVGITLLARLTDHYNLNAHYAYNLFDTLALEVRGGYAISRQTGLARQIAENFSADDKVKVADDLSNLWQMKGNAVAGLRWAPVYGKISLMSEVAAHFQLYLWAGGGAAQLHRQSLVHCVQRSGTRCNGYRIEDRFSPLGSAALGMRFFRGEHHSLKIEVRDYVFPDRYLENINREDALANRPTGEPARNPGLTHLVQLDLGYSYIF